MVSLFDKRPPFVRFETRPHGRNDIASQEAGRPIPNMVTFALITPHGSKDIVEKVATEWLAQKRLEASRGEFPTEWLQRFELQFSEWQKGNELPREGTPTLTWAAISQEQVARCIGCGFTTVEDIAEIPDSSLGILGLDGRYIRDLARSWIAEAKDKGINAKIVADQNALIESLRVRLDSLEARNAELEAKVGSAKSGKRNSEAA